MRRFYLAASEADGRPTWQCAILQAYTKKVVYYVQVGISRSSEFPRLPRITINSRQNPRLLSSITHLLLYYS